jgi:hypothetical protein
MAHTLAVILLAYFRFHENLDVHQMSKDVEIRAWRECQRKHEIYHGLDMFDPSDCMGHLDRSHEPALYHRVRVESVRWSVLDLSLHRGSFLD